MLVVCVAAKLFPVSLDTPPFTPRRVDTPLASTRGLA
jgi:hypothetical protein